MLTGIKMEPMLPAAGGVSAQRSASSQAERAPRFRQSYDQVELSGQPQGQERRVHELAARLSREVRTRPSRGDLERLQRQVQEGSYQPDVREIAARMLLIKKEDL